MKNFKKILALLIALIMVIPAIPVVASAEVTYQTATPEDTTYVDNLAGWLESAKDPSDSTGKTFLINDKDDLIYFMLLGQETEEKVTGTEVPTRFNGYTFKITNDIVFNEGTATADGFVPAEGTTVDLWSAWYRKEIEDSDHYWGFRATLDGQGHTIKGIVISEERDNLGFFTSVGNSAVIKDINFEEMYVNGGAKDYVGALIGNVGSVSNAVLVSNVSVDAVVRGRRYVGGVAGSLYSVKNSTKYKASVVMDGVTANVDVEAVISAAGLVARPRNEVDGTIDITNCFVDGTVKATNMVAGGFIAATGSYTTTISNSVCYANVSVTGSDTTVRAGAGGFIGVSESVTTMTNCQFLGSIKSNQNAWEAAFANVGDITVASYPDVKLTESNAPAELYPATFIDCYYVDGTGPKRAVGAYHRSSGKLNNWYKVTTDYTNDTEEAFTINIPDIYTAGTTGQAATGEAASAGFKTVFMNGHSGVNSAILGAQMDTANNARIIASVAAEKDIINVEFDVITLGEYMAKTPEKAADYWGAYKNSTQINCEYAYKTIKDNYGLGEIVADEGEYLVALVINGVEATTATTILVRTVYYEATIDAETGGYALNEDGTVKTTKRYGQYMAVTFYNGDILGVSYVG